YFVHPPQTRPEPEDSFNTWVLRLVFLGFVGAILLFFSLLELLAGSQFMKQDQIYSGVLQIYLVKDASMNCQLAIHTLYEQPAYADSVTFTFEYQDQQWAYTGTELGITFDSNATIDNAFAVGRSGAWSQNLVTRWRAWRDGQPVAPVITYNRTQAELQL